MMYVIDGYNVIYRLKFNEQGNNNLKKAREKLISFVETYCLKSKKNISAVLVFDSSGEYSLPNIIAKLSNFRIVFARGKSADVWIREFITKVKRKKEVTVVSDDKKDIKSYVKSEGCRVLSVQEFKARFDKVIPKRSLQVEISEKRLDPNVAQKINQEVYKAFFNTKKD
ncbi:MAG: NYN domain-containing protein [bacterium]